MAFDAFPKTLDELKERTLGGAAISIAATFLIALLFVSEFRQYRQIETIDRLDVDVSNTNSKIAINLDITLPSLPCSEFVVDVVDESGVQQLHVSDTLNKLRVDRHGVPIDVPKQVDWSHTIAPAFRHRKVMNLLDGVTGALRETMAEMNADEQAEGHDANTHEGHVAHRRLLAHRAMLLQKKLEQVSAIASTSGEVNDFLHMSHKELSNIKSRIEESTMYSEAQTSYVSSNLESMERNLLKLQQGVDGASAINLQEALRIRLGILQDNLRGFVSPEDIDRRDKYRAMGEQLGKLLNSTRVLELSDEERGTVTDEAVAMQASLDELADGAAGPERQRAEQRIARTLELIQETLVVSPLPDDYCGPCYGAGRDALQCCNSCEEVKAAYRTRRWGMPDEKNFEQCRREARMRAVTIGEGEGCNVFGSIEVHRSSGNLHLSPTSSAQQSAGGAMLQRADAMGHGDVVHFNVSHRINRLSFGDDFPGQINPLDGVERISPLGPGVARYFIKVVPTIYRDLSGTELFSNQFATTEYFKAVHEDDRLFQLPGVHFSYDITPLRVRLTEARGRTFLSFFVRCAATIGGVFTVAGMIDKIFYSSQRLLMKKLEIGKAM